MPISLVFGRQTTSNSQQPTANAMNLIEVVILAVVQGLTEFLPISSSGHLVLADALLNSGKGSDVLDVSIALHGGTLLSILVFYWRRVLRLLSEDRRVIWLLFVGTIPAVVIGLPLKYFGGRPLVVNGVQLLETPLLSNPMLAASMLPVTGLILLLIPRIKIRDTEYSKLSMLGALWIGLVQAFAILPGISRSGTTIAAGLTTGLSRRSAATFSFLLAIPAIGGAIVLDMKDQLGDFVSPTHNDGSTPIVFLAIGVFISFVVGLAALSWVVKWLERGRLQYFAYWCIPVGLAAVIWQLAVMMRG
jgi:undecaprenyl-diphosphatase